MAIWNNLCKSIVFSSSQLSSSGGVSTTEVYSSNSLPQFPPRFSNGVEQVRVKEVILIFMALALLVCSIMLFFKHWKKNYRDINQLAYSAYLYQKDDEVDAEVRKSDPTTTDILVSDDNEYSAKCYCRIFVRQLFWKSA
jgi:hypothetical protein